MVAEGPQKNFCGLILMVKICSSMAWVGIFRAKRGGRSFLADVSDRFVVSCLFVGGQRDCPHK